MSDRKKQKKFIHRYVETDWFHHARRPKTAKAVAKLGRL
jgi:hypothetical protein